MNLTYEDCKELKDAGFPQGESLDNVIAYGTAFAYLHNGNPSEELLNKYTNALKSLKEMYKDDKEYVYVPTLAELIEACGEGFFVLQRGVNNHWVASIGESNHFLGDSPEQAVKNLWIALNK